MGLVGDSDNAMGLMRCNVRLQKSEYYVYGKRSSDTNLCQWRNESPIDILILELVFKFTVVLSLLCIKSWTLLR